MKKREVAVIMVLAVLMLCIPVGIFLHGTGAAAARQWRERPYEGTVTAFLDEHIGLLDEAAEILWENPGFFTRFMGGGADMQAGLYRDVQAGIDRYDVWRDLIWQGPLTDAQWTVVQQLFEEQRCTRMDYFLGVWWYGWYETPVLRLRVDTTEEDGAYLLYFREDGLTEAENLGRWNGLQADYRIETTAYPNWYAAWWRE